MIHIIILCNIYRNVMSELGPLMINTPRRRTPENEKKILLHTYSSGSRTVLHGALGLHGDTSELNKTISSLFIYLMFYFLLI